MPIASEKEFRSEMARLGITGADLDTDLDVVIGRNPYAAALSDGIEAAMDPVIAGLKARIAASGLNAESAATLMLRYVKKAVIDAYGPGRGRLAFRLVFGEWIVEEVDPWISRGRRGALRFGAVALVAGLAFGFALGRIGLF